MTGACRALTAGERMLVAGVFGDAVDSEPVLLHREKWWAFQPRRVTMAPDGHMWFHPRESSWHPDFSQASLSDQGHFVHEMVHVWQHQCGIDLRFARPPFARYRYLPLVPGRPFGRYGIEQQAEIVRHAFLLGRGARLPDCPPLEVYAALIPFWRVPRRQTQSVLV